jgi:hypothetical protein
MSLTALAIAGPARFLHLQIAFLLPRINISPQLWKKFLAERDTVEVRKWYHSDINELPNS